MNACPFLVFDSSQRKILTASKFLSSLPLHYPLDWPFPFPFIFSLHFPLTVSPLSVLWSACLFLSFVIIIFRYISHHHEFKKTGGGSSHPHHEYLGGHKNVCRRLMANFCFHVLRCVAVMFAYFTGMYFVERMWTICVVIFFFLFLSHLFIFFSFCIFFFNHFSFSWSSFFSFSFLSSSTCISIFSFFSFGGITTRSFTQINLFDIYGVESSIASLRHPFLLFIDLSFDVSLIISSSTNLISYFTKRRASWPNLLERNLK